MFDPRVAKQRHCKDKPTDKWRPIVSQCQFVLSLACFILRENTAAAAPAAQKGKKNPHDFIPARVGINQKKRIKIAHFTVIIIRAIVLLLLLLLLRPNQGCRGQRGARKNASTTAAVTKKCKKRLYRSRFLQRVNTASLWSLVSTAL